MKSKRKLEQKLLEFDSITFQRLFWNKNASEKNDTNIPSNNNKKIREKNQNNTEKMTDKLITRVFF